MKTIETYLETFNENRETIMIVERWTFDAMKMIKPTKQWYFKKEKEIEIDENKNIDYILTEFKEYKSKQAVYKKFNKEKQSMEKE